MNNKKGLTLIELLVVISIIGVIAVIGTSSFREAQQKAEVENDAKRAYSLTAKARQLSFTWKEQLTLNISGGNLVVYDSAGNAIDGMKSPIDSSYALSGNIKFKNGFTSSQGYFYYNGSGVNAQYDCVLFDWNRIRLGKYGNNKCTPE